MTKHDPTRRSQIIEFIEVYRSEHEYGPTVREITLAVGLSSTGATFYQLQSLRSLGRVVWDERIARSVRIARRVA